MGGIAYLVSTFESEARYPSKYRFLKYFLVLFGYCMAVVPYCKIVDIFFDAYLTSKQYDCFYTHIGRCKTTKTRGHSEISNEKILTPTSIPINIMGMDGVRSPNFLIFNGSCFFSILLLPFPTPIF